MSRSLYIYICYEQLLCYEQLQCYEQLLDNIQGICELKR